MHDIRVLQSIASAPVSLSIHLKIFHFILSLGTLGIMNWQNSRWIVCLQ